MSKITVSGHLSLGMSAPDGARADVSVPLGDLEVGAFYTLRLVDISTEENDLIWPGLDFRGPGKTVLSIERGP